MIALHCPSSCLIKQTRFSSLHLSNRHEFLKIISEFFSLFSPTIAVGAQMGQTGIQIEDASNSCELIPKLMERFRCVKDFNLEIATAQF